MLRTALLPAAATVLLLATVTTPAIAQKSAYPPISAREFKSGSVKIIVTGSSPIDAEVQLNTKASIGDGEQTWLQYGASGSPEANSLITFGNGEFGIQVGKGKFNFLGGIIPGEAPQCKGKLEVTATSISGDYTCPGVTSHNQATGKMGKVDIKVQFTAKS